MSHKQEFRFQGPSLQSRDIAWGNNWPAHADGRERGDLLSIDSSTETREAVWCQSFRFSCPADDAKEMPIGLQLKIER